MIVRLITKEERLNYNMHQEDVLMIKNEKVSGRVNFAFKRKIKLLATLIVIYKL